MLPKTGGRSNFPNGKGLARFCGQPFRVKTPLGVNKVEQSKTFMLATCPAHRMTPGDAARLRYATTKENRAAVFETIKTRMKTAA